MGLNPVNKARNRRKWHLKLDIMHLFKEFIDYDIELEEKVLGVFLMEPLSYPLVISILRDECFYGVKTKSVYGAIKEIYEKGYGIDYLVVQRYFFDKKITHIEESNIQYIITTLQAGVVSSAHLVTWCLMLREMAANRLMVQIKNSGGLNGDAFEEATKLQDQLRDVLDIKVTDDWVHISKVSVKLGKHMDEMLKNGGIMGVSTSIPSLDASNGGFRDTNLIVIGARPSVGKSAFMGRIATHAAFKGKTVGIISLEMDDKDIFARNVAAESDIPHWQIDRNILEDEENERTKVYQAMEKLSKLPIYFSDTAQVSLIDIRAKIERLKQKHGVDLLIIDYLQLIEPGDPNNKNREQEVSKICRGLKLLAMNMKIPVIILAQLNRQSEEKGDKKPQLHHLRESGSIEQDADVVIFLHRDWVSGIKENPETGGSTKYEADLLVRKWRNGSTSDTKLHFDGPTMKFSEIKPKEEFTYQNKNTEVPNKPNAGFENRRMPFPPEKDEDLPF